MSSDSGNDGGSHGIESDGGTAVDRDEMETYTAVRGAVKDALLEVIGLMLQLGLGLALVFLGAQTILRSVALVGVAVGVLLLVTGILLAAPVLRLVQPLRV